jgi:hypothetical protein
MPISRRKFIKNATSGIALAWAGLSITAGTAGAAELATLPSPADGQTPATGLAPQRFVYGTQFYRPPSPPRELRREMVKALAEQHKFNLIASGPTGIT